MSEPWLSAGAVGAVARELLWFGIFGNVAASVCAWVITRDVHGDVYGSILAISLGWIAAVSVGFAIAIGKATRP